ncbi:MAG TPA: isoaspartyl peptidase/L-asparaginase [Bryobacteraceae bacterium]|nr:isoaspartyl peptidase/L-asparaginase [Bryobacteraceae bacterium]
MRNDLGFFLVAVPALVCAVTTGIAKAQSASHRWAIVLHGGAGVIERGSMTPEMESDYRSAMARILEAGAEVLRKGGSSLDAVEVSIRMMEDDPLFNAGRGAVFTAAGTHELDAAIMDGSNLRAGAVAGVTRTRHPITLARTVMEKSPHVMLAGPGADEFAAEQRLEQVNPSFFFTERRWQALILQLRKEGKPVPARPAGAPPAPSKPVAQLESEEAHKFGTVGIVAADQRGNVAAGTSTGGTQAKRPGRIGDSPIIGAGTYASNASCAVSATGTGEFFIRLTVAREICALVEYKKMPLQQAADEVIRKQLGAMKGDGGVIAVTPNGELAWSFNTPGMYRARIDEGGKAVISIYGDEP